MADIVKNLNVICDTILNMECLDTIYCLLLEPECVKVNIE